MTESPRGPVPSRGSLAAIGVLVGHVVGFSVASGGGILLTGGLALGTFVAGIVGWGMWYVYENGGVIDV